MILSKCFPILIATIEYRWAWVALISIDHLELLILLQVKAKALATLKQETQIDLKCTSSAYRYRPTSDNLI